MRVSRPVSRLTLQDKARDTAVAAAAEHTLLAESIVVAATATATVAGAEAVAAQKQQPTQTVRVTADGRQPVAGSTDDQRL